MKDNLKFKPGSLQDKLVLGKTVKAGNVSFQSGTKYANVNVYSKMLSISEMKAITNGSKCGEDGDYLAWSTSEWNVEGEKSKVVQVDKKQLCPSTDSKVFIHGFGIREEAENFCTKLGNSLLYVPLNLNHSTRILDYYRNIALEKDGAEFKAYTGGYSDFVINVFDSTANNDWLNMNTMTRPTYYEWLPGQPNAASQRCVFIEPQNQRTIHGVSWWDYYCSYITSFVCENSVQPILRLRGMCKDSKLETLWTPNNFGEQGFFGYNADKYCEIKYNKTNFLWEVKRYGEEKIEFWGTNPASTASGLLGIHEWTLYNESKKCTTEFESKIMLSLTACNDEEFTCNDGQCIPMESRCNGKLDCFDESDELECILIVSKPSYNKIMIPSPVNSTDEKLRINVKIVIHSILGIDEIKQSFYVSYMLVLTWKDTRLTYYNLKKNPNLNVLSEEEKFSLWTPDIILDNTKEKQKIVKDTKSLMQVVANSNHTYIASTLEEIENIYIFSGGENDLRLTRDLDVDFICKYNMALYPFDTQTCFMEHLLPIVENDFCFLDVDGLSYGGIDTN